MVAYLTKSDASEGFNQGIDFLNGSYLKYALTVNPNIYVSCIKQFWNTIPIKQVNDVTRLRVGKEFSRVETPLFEGMLIGQEIKEEGDADEQVEDVTARDDAQGDDTVANGEVPTVQPPSPQPQPQQQAADFLMSLLQEALDAYASLTRTVEHLEYDKVAQALEITKLQRRVKKLEKGNKARGRMIDEIDKDDVVVLMDEKEDDKNVEKAKVDESAQEDEPADVQEVVDCVTTAKLITEVVTSTITTAPSRRRKGVIEMDEEYARKLHAEINKDIDWDVAIDHVKLKAKEDPDVQRYQVMKRKPQIEAQA
uniref:Xylulose kinase-1 n=1 Tax=Tanacetum cinerariifolium TaxID=118510 RepID=A0A6L2P3H0_TANCI|nr:hypothetical protein [Tanacetum cinerariifolium]